MVQSKVSNFQVDENYLNVPLVFSKLTLKPVRDLVMNYRINLLLWWWKRSLCSESMETLFAPIRSNLALLEHIVNSTFPLSAGSLVCKLRGSTGCPKITKILKTRRYFIYATRPKLAKAESLLCRR